MDLPDSADPVASVRSRLAALVRLHGQAGLARKGGTTRRNVHRYLGSVKPPVDFLVRLVRSLGLNTSWLLLGTGPMYSGEAVGGDTGPRDLLTAIELADATAALRLHTLTQLPSLASYREVLQQLERAEDARASREKQMSDALKLLYNKAVAAAKFPSYDESLPLLRVIERLLPLVNAPSVAVPTYTFLGTVLNNNSNEDGASAYWRKALLIAFFAGETLGNQEFQAAVGLAISAMGKGDTGDALRFTTMLDMLEGHEEFSSRQHVQALNRMVRAECLVTLGRLGDGQAALQQGLALCTGEMDVERASFSAVVQLWAGLVPFDALAAQKVRDIHFAFTLASYALFTESAHELEEARVALTLAAQSGFAVHERDSGSVVAVLAALRGKRGRKQKRATAGHKAAVPELSPPEQFSHLVRRAQLARLRDEHSAAQEAEAAHGYFVAHCQAKHRYTLGAIMAHLKNLLLLPAGRTQTAAAAKARDWAKAELNRRYHNGFGVLATIPGLRDWLAT